MKKIFMTTVVTIAILNTAVQADALKNSLTNMLNQNSSTPGMIDLNRINANTKPAKPKKRSSKAIVATVNGKKVIKKEADAYIQKRTKGQIKDFDTLPKAQRKRLIGEMSISILAEKKAKSDLTDREKNTIYAKVWMQKEILKSPVSDEAVKKVYAELKEKSLKKDSTKAVPDFDAIKSSMKMQMTEKKVIANLTKDTNITIIDANMIAGSVDGILVSIEEANKVLYSLSKGKSKWSTLKTLDKQRVMKLLAPSKLVLEATKSDLTEEEKTNSVTNIWMQNSMRQAKVSEKELKNAYAKIEKDFKRVKPNKKLPELDKIKNRLKMQIAKEKVIMSLMKNAKIILK